MQTGDFHFDLPEALIAQQPLAERSASRLLHLDRDGHLADRGFSDIVGLLQPGDLLVVNDTRVLPARLHGHKASGGRIELLLERVLAVDEALVQLRASHAPRAGGRLVFAAGVEAEVIERQGPFYRLRFSAPVAGVLETQGHIPLPPYIRRGDVAADRERYQTVWARAPGAVAAPTAGLHFDAATWTALSARGVETGTLTLHVGAGTFAPLRPGQLASGRLHAEVVEVPAPLCAQIEACRQRGGRVVAVGTTTTRALESAAAVDGLKPLQGETDLFIRPGHRFRVVDALLTNFHLPESSLLMLVCAFGGHAAVMAAYRHAVAARYRFYSYGDAMFVEGGGVRR